MTEALTKDGIAYMVSRLLERGKEAKDEAGKDSGNEFNNGRMTAYYEMLNILKNDLLIRDQDISEYGLDIDLENTLL